jgi:pyruvate/2-oxoglutarate/acetoin dehydrogenase E1 component
MKHSRRGQCRTGRRHAAPWPDASAAYTDVQTTGAGTWYWRQQPPRQAELRAGRRACLADRNARRPTNVVVLGEDVGRGGIFGQYSGLQAGVRRRARHRHPDQRGRHHGRRGGHGAGGLRPVVEMRVADFACAAWTRSSTRRPRTATCLAARAGCRWWRACPIGIWDASAAQHSQSLEAWFAHLPGVVVVCPSTPQDNYSLLRAALACGDPVIYIEHKTLWGSQGEVDETLQVPLWPGRTVRAAARP